MPLANLTPYYTLTSLNLPYPQTLKTLCRKKSEESFIYKLANESCSCLQSNLGAAVDSLAKDVSKDINKATSGVSKDVDKAVREVSKDLVNTVASPLVSSLP